MKSFMILLALMWSSVSLADVCSTAQVSETKTISAAVPAQLQDALIIVITPKGEQYAFEANNYKVVPRKQERLVVKETISCKADPKLNRVSLLAGSGAQSGLKTRNNGTTAEVQSNVGLVGGVQYQRLVNDKLSIGVQVQSSETALGVIGLDF